MTFVERQKQIEDAAMSVCDSNKGFTSFIAGAQWADKRCNNILMDELELLIKECNRLMAIMFDPVKYKEWHDNLVRLNNEHRRD